MNRAGEPQSVDEEEECSKTKLRTATEGPTVLKVEENNGNNSGCKKEEGCESVPNFALVVAAHYNSIEEYNIEKRNDSRIVYLRNFNNWIKSMLIKEAIYQLPEKDQRNFKLLDLCCGKGGDLLKWTRQGARYMICTDIAENSLDQFKSRYNEYKQKNGNYNVVECEFIPADCTKVNLKFIFYFSIISSGKSCLIVTRLNLHSLNPVRRQNFPVRLRSKYRDPSIQLDIVSCQFSFHYCFESLPQAECMLKNVSECLKSGGIFLGTIPNANEIVKRLRKSNSKCFKNDVFSLEMTCDEPYPLFGAKYHFFLEGVVNCPEFLVHFPTFEKLASKYGLKLIQSDKFGDFFEKQKRKRYGDMLLKKMKALETYPPGKEGKLLASIQDYDHAKNFCEKKNVSQVGTLSKSEWEVASLYQTFIFKKIGTK